MKCGLCGIEVPKGNIKRLSKKDITDHKGRLLPKFSKFANHKWAKGKVKVCKKCQSTD